ncbi:microtubule-associated protein 65-5 [Perilla frutescens var. frutescens]|nr:microtubule-associated protein 65-5 [Perilla frutescens var. frutescens]
MSTATIGSPLSLSKSATTTCASLLCELQEIWDEIGESETERDKMLLQLEQECLDIYRRKVERSRKHKAELQQSLAEFEAEIARVTSALGELVSVPRYEKMNGGLKHRISVISPTLGSLRLKKQERVKEISEIEFQIAVISAEIAGTDQILDPDVIQVDELDLTTKKLGELKSHLQELQFEKNLRLQKVTSHLNVIHGLSVVMSLDFKMIMAKIHPSFVDTVAGQSKSISNEILARLTSEMNSLKQEKQQRLLKAQNYGRTLMELWSLMDAPVEERKRFDHVMCLITSTVDEVVSPGSLSIDVIEQTEVEIQRLNVLKATKMKELILKRQSELEEIYEAVHMDIDIAKARQLLVKLMESGTIDLSNLLSSMDDQIAKAKEQAQSRKDILDKVEKWKHASEEESWLDEYERDENRYSAGKGVHKNLKRAEKARILVSKIPYLVESLTAKVKAWELEKGMPFLYNKAPLLRTLEEFIISLQVKEEEKRRSREQKKLQDQLATEQEALFGSKPNVKRPLGPSTNANTMAMAAATPNSRRLGTPARFGASGGNGRRESGKVGGVIPINYVALSKEDRGG